MPKDLFVFSFLSREEAARVLWEGKVEWHSGYLLLDAWHPTTGCERLKKKYFGG